MTDRSIAATIAVGFFVLWLCILLAGADFPPPIGFLWVILLDLIAAYLVYVRTPVYSNWLDNGEKIRGWLRALLDGLAVGLVFALATMLFWGAVSQAKCHWIGLIISSGSLF
ncbi:MAG: hypothetical protein MI924_12200 [Chloroflexales bacterium]|nr:hypothetical protein [Chloroflexales bacterium]